MNQPKVEFKPEIPLRVHSIEDLVKDTSVVKIYANGFQTSASLADATIIFKLQDVPVALVNLTLPALKSLHDQIGLLLTSYSANTNQPVSSFEELTSIIRNYFETKK